MTSRLSVSRAKPDPSPELACPKEPSEGESILWLTVGFALFYAAMLLLWTVPETPSLLWWVTRPLWIIGPALATIPLLAVTTRAARSR